MLALISSIPAMVLVWIIVFYMFSSAKTKEKMEDLFLLDTTVVEVFFWVVVIGTVVMILNFVLPLGIAHNILSLVEYFIAIIWFMQCLFAGKVGIWITLVKEKISTLTKTK